MDHEFLLDRILDELELDYKILPLKSSDKTQSKINII